MAIKPLVAPIPALPDSALKTNVVLPLGELIQYHCAVAVSEELHFTRAARRLHLDQSAVSRHIQKLESKIGTKLFARGGRGIELTDAGIVFIPYARKSLVCAGQGERLAQTVARGEPRECEIAYSPLIDVHLISQISRIAADVKLRVPLRFESVADEKLTERLFEGSSQAAIGILPAPDALATVCILQEKLFVALPTSHRLAGRSMIQAAELADDPVIWSLQRLDSASTQHFMNLFRRAGYLPRIGREAQSVAESLGLVREGFGIAIAKASELYLGPKELVLREFAEPYLISETGLIYLREQRWEFLKEFVSLVTKDLRCTDNQRP